MTESIIFDLDGTLWDSSDSVAEAWTTVLRQQDDPAISRITVTKENMFAIMGKAMDKIAAILFPMLNTDTQMELLQKCMDYENGYVAQHGGSLFADEMVLSDLAKNRRLFIVSNCQKGYIEAFLTFSGFGRYFTDHMCWGDTLKPKSFTIRELMTRNGCTDAAYVGDTQGDCDASYDAGIPFIHAAYGFGSISTPDRVNASISSLDLLSVTLDKL